MERGLVVVGREYAPVLPEKSFQNRGGLTDRSCAVQNKFLGANTTGPADRPGRNLSILRLKSDGVWISKRSSLVLYSTPLMILDRNHVFCGYTPSDDFDSNDVLFVPSICMPHAAVVAWECGSARLPGWLL